MSLSKVLSQKLQGMSCADVFHPGETCAQMNRSNVTRLLPAVAVYFVPLVFEPVFRNLGHLRVQDVRDALMLFGSMGTSAYVASLVMQFAWCPM